MHRLLFLLILLFNCSDQLITNDSIEWIKDLTVDFENENGKFNNILINITGENEVLIYSNEGKISQANNNISFELIDGLKTEIKENNIEHLKFDTYLATYPIDDKKIYIPINSKVW